MLWIVCETGLGKHVRDTVEIFNQSFFKVGWLYQASYCHGTTAKTPLILLDYQKIYATEILYNPAMLLTKLSLFLVYHRLFSSARNTRWLIYLGIGVNTIFYAVTFALTVRFSYRNVKLAQALAISQASFNTSSDIYLLCLPIPVISKLQLSRKKKLGIIAVFMTGVL